MDIPSTGAIFTLGKSYLAENSQSYFYIKNDPIKRLIAGPYQSAVICESGRLFVWGENHYGQLGIGGHTSNANNTNNNTSNNNVDIIIKPTCVKSLKTLGLKIADIGFGSDWSVILTYSNELFFTGRNIFNSESPVSSNFTETTVNGEPCEIIRKPFRLEEFDDCLSNNEEAESFVNVLAGNEHFVVLTSFGRLIGWGSNQSNQLGNAEEPLLKPHEIVLDSPVKQFACGPSSTLVLTEKGNLYLTGHLNEFVFTNFTELQKNLSPNEQITFVHISHASEIFIVTNTGSIYRSYESLRNKSLIFQRFYDYDSEENGPIWKLLKGTSFFAVLTRAHKFYTTFSESGHHLKTFREISKFKNLRLMDMALGDRHVLVHGVPRSSALAATMGPGAEHRLLSQSTIMANTTGGLMGRMKNTAKTKPDTILEETTITPKNIQLMEPALERPKTNTPVHETPMEEEQGTDQNTTDTNNNVDHEEGDNNNVDQMSQNSLQRRSPTESLKSRKSTSSTKKSVRPRTPFPETSGGSSPQTAIERTPIRNTSYQAAMDEDYIDHTSPRLVESLENIPEAVSATKPGVTLSMPTPPTEEDEQLTVEIRETTDPLDHTVTINEIRFINNGIDVTANVKKERESEDSLDETEDDDEDDTKSIIKRQAQGFIANAEQEVEEQIEKVKVTKADVEESVKDKALSIGNKVGEKFKVTKVEAEDAIKETSTVIEDKVEESLTEAKASVENVANAADAKAANVKESIETTAMKAVTGAKGAFDVVGENAKKAAKGAKQTMENVGTTVSKATDDARQAIESVGSSAAKATGEAKDSMGNAIRKMADDTRNAVGAVTSKISHEVQDAKNSLSSLLQGKKNKVDVEKPAIEIQESVADELQAEISAKESGGSKTNPTSQSTNTPGGAQEDDERTTASVNSAHTSSGNPFENNNPFESSNPFENDENNGGTIPYDPELDAMIERSKKAFQEDVERASMATEHHLSDAVTEVAVEEKSKFSKFLDDMREKSKSLSCRNEKAVQIIEDQPPRYSVEDELALQPVNARPENGSKVCTIL
ncbi:X-linked retinitis pigmentosa GTPase regulator [Musca domestica]|uniref:X-linked retinitis pigmentosa GTPase regulator n=1 Tax=Musca domestica TaxID=7370 RepID=A0A9J7IIE2_MUSDO|nr:X-linked retinitis pigmentosa GTPase regulator [Musca domestica]